MSSGLKSWIHKTFTRAVPVQAPLLALPEPQGNARETMAANDPGLPKLAVIVGHTKEFQGAQMPDPFKLTEYAYNRDLADCIRNAAKGLLDVEVILRDGQGLAGAYARAEQFKCDFAIELHFNAHDGKKRGVEAHAPMASLGYDLAHYICASIAQVLKFDTFKVRSVSRASKSASNLYAFPTGANCVVLPFYGDNLEDARLGVAGMELIAAAIIRGVLNQAKQLDLIQI